MFPVPFSFLSTPPYGPLGGVKTKTYMCCLDSKKGLFLPKKAKKQVEKWPFLAKKVFDHVHKNVCSEKNKNTHFFFKIKNYFSGKNFLKRTNSSLKKVFPTEKIYFRLAQWKIFRWGLTPHSKKFFSGHRRAQIKIFFKKK